MATPEEKRWAKEARSRRQALKKATPPPTNLFQARIRRTELNHRPRSNGWVWVLLVLIGGGLTALWWTQRVPVSAIKLTTTTIAVPKPTLASTLQASSAPVVTPVSVSVAPVVNTDNAVSTPVTNSVMPDTREWHDASSDVHDQRQVIIKSRKNLKALWQNMGRTDDVPRVNFYDYWVAGIFAGEKTGTGSEVQMDMAKDTPDACVINYRITTPVPEPIPGTGKTYPWQLRVIIRPEKPVHFIAVSSTPSQASNP